MNKKLLITLILALIFYSSPKKAISHIFGHKSDLISVVGKAQHKKLDPKNLNILVWNIKKAENPYFIDDYKNLASNHQIILIQEGIFNENVIRDYLKIPGYQAVIASSFHLPFGNPDVFTGGTTISKAPSIKNVAIKTFFKEPVAKTPKMTLFTKYPINGSKKSLLVVNIHAINFVSNKTFKFEEIKKNHNFLSLIIDFKFHNFLLRQLHNYFSLIKN
jgi:endonuclease/exonuclease/phosphatase (EEP) superfamily protein YafD